MKGGGAGGGGAGVQFMLVSFVTTDEYSVRVTKITSKIGIS